MKEMSFKSGVKRRASFAQDEVNQDTGQHVLYYMMKKRHEL